MFRIHVIAETNTYHCLRFVPSSYPLPTSSKTIAVQNTCGASQLSGENLQTITTTPELKQVNACCCQPVLGSTTYNIGQIRHPSCGAAAASRVTVGGAFELLGLGLGSCDYETSVAHPSPVAVRAPASCLAKLKAIKVGFLKGSLLCCVYLGRSALHMPCCSQGQPSLIAVTAKVSAAHGEVDLCNEKCRTRHYIWRWCW